MSDRPRIILALPSVMECANLSDWLVEDGLEPVRRITPAAARDEMGARPFDLLIVDADFAFRDGLRATGRVRNPGTPTIVIGDAAAAKRCALAGQWAMFVERPVDRAMLSCTVSMAIMDARPTRRSARKAVSWCKAVVNGVTSLVVDISNEGVRLEVPSDRRWTPPPVFSVRIAMIGAAVTMQRMWVRPLARRGRPEMTACGAALASNNPAIEHAWKAFVDAVPAVGISASSLRVE